jgi:hypothetical protein
MLGSLFLRADHRCLRRDLRRRLTTNTTWSGVRSSLERRSRRSGAACFDRIAPDRLWRSAVRLGEALSWNVDLQHGRQSADAHVRLHTLWTVASRSYGEVDAEVVDDKAADRAVRSQIGSGGLS